MTKYDDCEKLCEEHVDWFLKIIRPILIEHMKHGYKHGFERGAKEEIYRK